MIPLIFNIKYLEYFYWDTEIGGCQGLGEREMGSCFEWVQSFGCTRWKSCRDWLYNNVNVLNATEW